MRMRVEIRERLRDCRLLLLAQPVRDDRRRVCVRVRHHAMILRELDIVALRRVRRDLEPLRALAPRDAELLQIRMEICILEIAIRLRHERRAQMPPELRHEPCRMRLLLDARLYLALRKANLRPTRIRRHIRQRIGIALRRDLRRRPDLDCRHHAISFTCVSIKSISFSSSPYLR